MTGPYRGKRAVDLCLLALCLVPATIAGVACAIAVRLTSPGPIFFRQTRAGMGGREFEILKFRTMIDAPDNPILPADDRITRAGRWLRRLSLDEIPQLVNVARGEMSIVGPRPTLPYQVERYTERQRRRLAVRPGITGLAQVTGRNELPWAARIEIDIEYVERQSAALDLRILVATVAVVLRGSGVEGHPADDDISAPSPGD
ncbi:MAG TPA: sugar transferase [Candidatus Limnocylindrales bacterium]|nr:sugar transferase [Candidatus Limnocylindrales bacterium]